MPNIDIELKRRGVSYTGSNINLLPPTYTRHDYNNEFVNLLPIPGTVRHLENKPKKDVKEVPENYEVQEDFGGLEVGYE